MREKVLKRQVNLVRWYVYLVLASQVRARSSLVDNSAPAVNPQQVFKNKFNTLPNEEYSIDADIERHQSILEHAI